MPETGDHSHLFVIKKNPKLSFIHFRLNAILIFDIRRTTQSSKKRQRKKLRTDKNDNAWLGKFGILFAKSETQNQLKTNSVMDDDDTHTMTNDHRRHLSS